MSDNEKSTSRRDMLKLAALGAPVAAVAAVAPKAAEAAVAETAGEGLRKTEHVKKYLETARF
ncbi:MAG: twin-arginine translocation signal domain-containing protein [Pseudomonadota bacterium]